MTTFTGIDGQTYRMDRSAITKVVWFAVQSAGKRFDIVKPHQISAAVRRDLIRQYEARYNYFAGEGKL